MSTQPFQDGFPNQAQAAINASYFLSNEDRNEWFEWLKTADEQQQDELINILHTMWEDAQRQNSPQNGQSQSAPTTPQPQQQYNSNQGNDQSFQSQGVDNNIVQPMANAMTNIEIPEPVQTPEVASIVSQPQPAAFSLDKPPVEAISQPKITKKDLEVDEGYKPSTIITEPEMIEEPEEDSFEFDTVEDVETSKVETDKNIKKVEKESQNFETDQDEQVETFDNEAEKSSTKRLSSGGIDFVSIRSNTKKEEILSIKDDFVNSRQSHEKSFENFVEKVTTVICEFEEVNDYIEAMTDKVLSINDEVINQAQDIQDLKNQTQNRGGSLQDQIDEVKYDVEKILKEIRNIRIEIKRSNDEIRSRLSILEADSFRAENDGINQKLSVIKSELSKLQDAHVTGGQPQTFSEQFKNRSSKLDNIKFQK
jgi:hypothetical protein